MPDSDPREEGFFLSTLTRMIDLCRPALGVISKICSVTVALIRHLLYYFGEYEITAILVKGYSSEIRLAPVSSDYFFFL